MTTLRDRARCPEDRALVHGASAVRGFAPGFGGSHAELRVSGSSAARPMGSPESRAARRASRRDPSFLWRRPLRFDRSRHPRQLRLPFWRSARRRTSDLTAKKAFITGITGQDGSYLAELLLDKGYEVHGLVRRSSSFNTWRIDHIRDRLVLHYGDLVDQNSLMRTLAAGRAGRDLQPGRPEPREGLLRDARVHGQRDRPRACCALLDAVRELGLDDARLPGGQLRDVRPRPGDAADGEARPSIRARPTACAKVFGHWMAVNYREGYGMHVSNGILFNHESPRRGENFVTRKITHGRRRHQEGPRARAAPRQPRRQARLGLRRRLRRGHVAHAPAGPGRTTTWWPPARPTPCGVPARRPSRYVGLDWQKYVKVDPKYFRPAEVDLLLGDPAKAKHEARLDAEGRLQGAGAPDGRRRPGRRGQPVRPRG